MDLHRVRVLVIHRVDRLRSFYPADLAFRAYADFSRNDGSIFAAAVTYYAIFSLFPLLIFLFAVSGIFVRDPQIKAQVVDEIVRQLPASLVPRSQVDQIVSSIALTPTGIAGFIGLAGLAWTASGMFRALRRALNNAFDIQRDRSFVHGRSLDLASVLGVVLLTFVSVLLSAAIGAFRAISDELFHGFLTNLGWAALYLLFPLVISWLVFFIVYRWIPNHAVDWHDIWLGALLAAIGFELAKAGFGLYLINFGRFSEIYGTVGGVLAFLFFVFLESNVVIFGAELASEIAKDRVAAGNARSIASGRNYRRR